MVPKRSWTASLVLTVACGATPPGNATTAAVGVDGWSPVDLGVLRLELPGEAFEGVEVRWRRQGEERAELRLGGAPLGATLDGLADEEVRALRALEPEAVVSTSRVRWLDVPARRISAGHRSVVVAMRNPWRVARLFVRGPGAEALRRPGAVRIAGVSLDPNGWTLDRVRFEASSYVVRCEQRCTFEARGETAPEEGVWERIRASVSARRSDARSGR